MKKYNAKNERIKKEYLIYQKEANQKSDGTLNGIRKAIFRFEEYTGFKELGTFNKKQAMGFKKHLAQTKNAKTKQPISKSTLLSTINNLKEFFKWLAYQKGYKSKIELPDIEYLNLSEKEVRMAKQPNHKDFATIEQIKKVIFSMPNNTDIEKRNRALIAFTLLTGMRDKAITSLKLKHINIEREVVRQNPNEGVETKFSKRIDTYFFPVGDEIKQIVIEWIEYLRTGLLYGNDDPLFPRTKLGHDENLSFVSKGLEPVNWSTTSPVRTIFREAFENAGLQYFNPHSFRRYCKIPIRKYK